MMSDQPFPTEHHLPVMPLNGFTTAVLGNALAVVRLNLFTSPESLDGATRAVLVGMTPDQATALGKSLLQVVETIRSSQDTGPM